MKRLRLLHRILLLAIALPCSRPDRFAQAQSYCFTGSFSSSSNVGSNGTCWVRGFLGASCNPDPDKNEDKAKKEYREWHFTFAFGEDGKCSTSTIQDGSCSWAKTGQVVTVAVKGWAENWSLTVDGSTISGLRNLRTVGQGGSSQVAFKLRD